MKKKLRKAAILFLIFILGVAGTALLLNSESTDNRSDMNDATLPEIMIDMGGTMANRMYGYSQPMQADFTRDCVTPLDTSKKLTFVIIPYEAKVSSFSYEIRTSDGSKVMENKKIKNLEPDGDNLRVTIEIGSDLRMNQEYSLQISLETDTATAYYYTRVVSKSQVNANEYVAFVNMFSQSCLDKNAADGLASYLEPANNGSATNYSSININSTLSEVSWGSMQPQIYKEGVPVIKEINETTASISLEYQITSLDDEDNMEIYDVEEFYRLRYDDSRIRLLDFQRSANQIFNPELQVFSNENIILGIRDKNVEYMMNDSATVIAFVQQGDLWSYSPENGKITEVFTFRKKEDGDFRDSRQKHDIKIIRISEEGDIDFVLYGYMNRGNHEGENGIGVYHYNNDQNVIEERAFIPITESYEFLKRDLGTLSYVNQNNELFLLFAQKLYQINITDDTYEVLEEGIENSNFVVSDSSRYAAWLVTQGEDAGKIRYIDFDDKQTGQIDPEDGKQLRAVGYMNDDLVYGILDNADILTDENGHVTEGIQMLRIVDFDGNVKKEYQKSGLYITDITVGNTLIEFNLSAKSGNLAYVAQKKDNIMNNKKAAANNVKVELFSSSRTGVRVRLSINQKADSDSPLVLYAKIRSAQKTDIQIDTQVPQEETYYVYAHGGLNSVYIDPAQAILQADAQGGVVLNRAQQYVWERGNKKTRIQFSIEDVPEIFKTGTLDINQLKEQMTDSASVIDLSGCSLDSVLYEVSAQRPVIAKTGSGTSVVIVGYDEYNTYLYDPGTGETYPYGMNDSTQLFANAGNVFISYMEAVAY